jgi:hypothetical protein
VIAGGVHVHDAAPALAAIRARDKKDASALVEAAVALGGVAAAHGLDVVVALAGLGPDGPDKGSPAAPLAWRRDTLKALAGERPLAMEIVFEPVDQEALVGALKTLASSPKEAGRLLLAFWAFDETRGTPTERAQALARGLDGDVTQVQSLVLVENVVRKKRLAVEGLRQGASIISLHGELVRVHAQLWRTPPPRKKGKREVDEAPLDAAVMQPEIHTALRAGLGPKPFELVECAPESWGNRVRVEVRTTAPADMLTVLAAYAKTRGAMVWLGVQDMDVLARAVRRVLGDVAHR